jgi:GNAT superfamily N-acetyltransferase
LVLVVGLVVVVRPTAEAFASKMAAVSVSASSSTSSSSSASNNKPINNDDETRVIVSPIDRGAIPLGQLPIVPTQDLIDLSDLRYDEWVVTTVPSDDESSLGSQPQPSRYAFRMATAEIATERSEAGAVCFLARLHRNRGPLDAAMGAAELSPIEFEGAIQQIQIQQLLPPVSEGTTTNDSCGSNNSRKRWYITDVVTSSKHRRMGIANALMDALERHAYQQQQQHAQQRDREKEGVAVAAAAAATTTTLYLHVKDGNDAAMAFYANPDRGYSPPTPCELVGLDTEKLAANAGTLGQTLLCKTLTDANVPPEQRLPELSKIAPELQESNTTKSATVGVAASGFGKGSKEPAKKKSKKKAGRKKK